MKARHVKGKRIAWIRQVRFSDRGVMKTDVLAIVLEDGTEIVPLTIETQDGAEYAHDFAVRRPEKKKL